MNRDLCGPLLSAYENEISGRDSERRNCLLPLVQSAHECTFVPLFCFVFSSFWKIKMLEIGFCILTDGVASSFWFCAQDVSLSLRASITLDSAQNIHRFEGNTLWFLLSNCLAENNTFLVTKSNMVPIQAISNGNFLTKNWYIGFLFCFVLSFV